MRGWVTDRVRRGLNRALAGSQATPLDVFYAYRILLRRAPDAEGWRHYLTSLRSERPAIGMLVDGFLHSREFQQRNPPVEATDAGTARDIVVELPRFDIIVNEKDLTIGRAIATRGEYEPHVTRILSAVLEDGHTFVDVGANIGFFSLLAARIVGPTGRVLAFEPARANTRLLTKSVRLNAFQNVQLFPMALLESNRAVEFMQWEETNSGSFHLLNDPDWPREVFTVEGRCFDDLDLGHVDLIKMDVEGAEWLALQGMLTTLERSRPLLVLEYTPASLEDLSGICGNDLLRELERLGYGYCDAESFDGQLRPASPDDVAALLARRGVQHLDLLLFPRDRIGARLW